MPAVNTSAAAHLLTLPVRLHGIQLGRPVDLLLDREELRVLGFDVRCRDDEHRFLPLPTAAISDDAITIQSPLVLLEEDELAFYRARALTLASLRGCQVTRGGRFAGALKDVVVAPGGSLVEVVVDAGGVEHTLPFDASVRFEPGSRTAA